MAIDGAAQASAQVPTASAPAEQPETPSITLLELAPTELSLQPGDSATVHLKVRNRGGRVDQFQLGISGVEPAWVAIDHERSTLFPGDAGDLAFTVHVPSDATAATTTITTHIVAFDSQQSVDTDVPLRVLPTGGFGVQLVPRRVRATIGRFALDLVNPGNAERVLDLLGTDPEQALAISFFGLDRVAVPPGSASRVPLVVRRHARGGGLAREYPFSVQVFAADLDTHDLQFVADGILAYQPAWPWRLLAWLWRAARRVAVLAVLVAVVLLGIAWRLGEPGDRVPYPTPTLVPSPTGTPRPTPTLTDEQAQATATTFQVEAAIATAVANAGAAAAANTAGATAPGGATSPGGASAGGANAPGGANSPGGAGAPGTLAGEAGATPEPTETPQPIVVNSLDLGYPPDGQPGDLLVSWDIANATAVTVAGTPQPATGTAVVPNLGNGQVDIQAANDGTALTTSIGVLVLQPPHIIGLSAMPTEVEVGDMFMFSWATSGASEVDLEIPGLDPMPLDPAGGNFRLGALVPGTITLTLVATNDIGRVQQQVSVHVNAPADADASNGD